MQTNENIVKLKSRVKMLTKKIAEEIHSGDGAVDEIDLVNSSERIHGWTQEIQELETQIMNLEAISDLIQNK